MKPPQLRRIFPAFPAIAAGALLTAGIAWACTAQAYISISPDSGPAGTEVTVVGRQFQDGPVGIYWNSARGLKLGEAPGPNFTTVVTIPDDPERFGYVYAVGYNKDGSVAGAARWAFTITSNTPGDAQPGDSARPERQRSSRRTSGGELRDRSAAPSRERAGAGTVTAARRAEAERAGRDGGSASSPAAGAAVTSDSRRVFAGSVAPRREQAAPSPVAARRTGDPARFGPSEQTASADLWSGLGAATSPSLTPASEPATPRDGSGSLSRLAAGLGLLAAGLVALMVGAFAAARRRSARVTARGESSGAE